MSKSFLPMMFTCITAVAVYYLFALELEVSGIYSMGAGIAVAVLISWIFARRHKRKKED